MPHSTMIFYMLRLLLGHSVKQSQYFSQHFPSLVITVVATACNQVMGIDFDELVTTYFKVS